MMMEILLKERLVGAAVLVLAAVIFIPMVLDGPDSAKVSRSVALPERGAAKDDRRTVRIDLDAQADDAAAVTQEEPVSVDLTERQEPEVADEKDPAGTEAEKRAGTQASTSVEAAQSTPPASTPAQEGNDDGGAPWTVQVGSFSQGGNAETLAAELRELGFPAYVSRFDGDGQVLHRVRVGGFPTRESAAAEAERIRSRTDQPARPARNR